LLIKIISFYSPSTAKREALTLDAGDVEHEN